MTVKECAVEVAKLLQIDDTEALLSSEDAAEEELMADEDVKAIVMSVNLAASEISGDGFPVVKTAEVEAENGEIPLDALPCLLRVLSVSRGGRRVRFAVGRASVSVADDGVYAVEYTAAASDKGLSEELELGAFAHGLALYLAARNYCLITGRTDEASIWDQRYAAESEKRRLCRKATLPPRRWA